MTGILGQLKEVEERQYTLLIQRSKSKASLPTDCPFPLTRSGINHHSMAFLTSIAGTDIYKGSYLVLKLHPEPVFYSAEIAKY